MTAITHEHVGLEQLAVPIDGGPAVRAVVYGEDTHFSHIRVESTDFIPFTTFMTNGKEHTYFVPGGIPAEERIPRLLAERSLRKMDPRISCRPDPEQPFTTFHGVMVPDKWRGNGIGYKMLDALFETTEGGPQPITCTTIINKPSIAAFVAESSYGFKPEHTNAMAEIIGKAGLIEPHHVIRWLYNTLPLSERTRVIRGHTFYEVEGEDEIIASPKAPSDPANRIVAMHTRFIR